MTCYKVSEYSPLLFFHSQNSATLRSVPFTVYENNLPPQPRLTCPCVASTKVYQGDTSMQFWIGVVFTPSLVSVTRVTPNSTVLGWRRWLFFFPISVIFFTCFTNGGEWMYVWVSVCICVCTCGQTCTHTHTECKMNPTFYLSTHDQ